MSDDVPAVAEVVYSAFGEIVYQDLSVGTRYRCAAKHGYECFDDMDWGEFGGVPFEFPYLHLGHRWYDPATGRFLQRDPIGIRGGGAIPIRMPLETHLDSSTRMEPVYWNGWRKQLLVSFLL